MEGRASFYPERTLIVAQGLERERIIAAVSHHAPTKLILLRNRHDLEGLRPLIKETISLLKDDLLKSKTTSGLLVYHYLQSIEDSKEVDFFDLAESISIIDSIIKEELKAGRQVCIDIAAGGNKIIAVALFIAAQLNKVPVSYTVGSEWGDANYIKAIREELREKRELKPSSFEFSVSGIQPLPYVPLCIGKIHFDALERLARQPQGRVSLVKELVESDKKGAYVGVARKLRWLMRQGYVIGVGKGYQITEQGRRILALKSLAKEEKRGRRKRMDKTRASLKTKKN